jgi:hypothetical protein
MRGTVLPALDWLTRSFADGYERCLERGSAGLRHAAVALKGDDADGLSLGVAGWPLVDMTTAPRLPASVDWALSSFGIRAEAVDMNGVLPLLLCTWLGASLLGKVPWLLPRRADAEPPDSAELPALQPGSWWLCRVLFLRCLGGVYLTAFLVALHQNPALLGDLGLLPASAYMQQLRRQLQVPTDGGAATLGAAWPAFMRVPGLLWFIAPGAEDAALATFALLGIALSALLLCRGSGNMPIMITLWMLYMSIAMAGQRWYGFGWESQLLETGFLSIFLCPSLSLAALPEHTPTPLVTRWGFRWLIFRIMLGAGLIKIRGDQCWRDLTCMDYHYETQPVPNPLAWYLHANYKAVHAAEVLVNHFVELVAPWLLLPMLPRACMLLGGAIQVLFQCALIISGESDQHVTLPSWSMQSQEPPRVHSARTFTLSSIDLNLLLL